MNLIINPVAFRLGSMSIKWYGILMASGIVIALLMAIVEGKKRQIMPEDFSDFLLWGVPIGFVGARLYYVIFKWDYFAQNPGQIFAIWNGGIAIYGGLLT
ncbi:MAG: prolipoprotein diacylglyceryl transferase, partial [Lactobacillus iners]|nr:prolipoprotein diacylglyceryl transferase [Lactobacillus iners]MCT7808892.1 prolipoprotein diacylglyceryl transferase [Lactobacillus iners]